MKSSVYFILSLILFSVVFVGVSSAPKGIWKLFGYDPNGYQYPNGYNSGYYYPQKPRYGKSYNSEGGGRRYASICHVHAVDTLAFPGRVGNPVCPY